MARKVEMQSIGTPAVLKIVETDAGPPGTGQVRLVQDAIGINYVDVMVRTGLFPMRLPATPGFEAASVIDAAGPGVTGFERGDRAAQKLVRLPHDISNEVAATFLAKGLTAWMGFMRCTGSPPASRARRIGQCRFNPFALGTSARRDGDRRGRDG
ncbi:alcohol dehydrogenase catalytic domain-containing protein (plasmid) [Sinorhizobium meliloti]|uniref:alcohol dehydrogenase catalytic domain-containing protein n=1 Tax=Rhizobium meliloti TaxID=382 RepID=UPI00244E25A9|nr:alcohol dehydrogenase catalytic domain-containing protein [Sinorhizobium meliloti]WGI76887.1 alcohol dehydrogenase catalytic domain-containing protein [Sinorhizobium meliloti]